VRIKHLCDTLFHLTKHGTNTLHIVFIYIFVQCSIKTLLTKKYLCCKQDLRKRLFHFSTWQQVLWGIRRKGNTKTEAKKAELAILFQPRVCRAGVLLMVGISDFCSKWLAVWQTRLIPILFWRLVLLIGRQASSLQTRNTQTLLSCGVFGTSDAPVIPHDSNASVWDDLL
jgi:hypothetical protein